MTDSRQLTSIRGSFGHLARGVDALVEIVQGPLLLERIARCHQPPHAIELQTV